MFMYIFSTGACTVFQLHVSHLYAGRYVQARDRVTCCVDRAVLMTFNVDEDAYAARVALKAELGDDVTIENPRPSQGC